jgi:hypothetical protein
MWMKKAESRCIDWTKIRGIIPIIGNAKKKWGGMTEPFVHVE